MTLVFPETLATTGIEVFTLASEWYMLGLAIYFCKNSGIVKVHTYLYVIFIAAEDQLLPIIKRNLLS